MRPSGRSAFSPPHRIERRRYDEVDDEPGHQEAAEPIWFFAGWRSAGGRVSHVAVGHLIVSDCSPQDAWRETGMARVIDAASGVCANYYPP